MNELHERFEKIEAELLKAKVEHKREMKYKVCKKKKLIEKIEESRDEFDILQREVGRRNTEKQMLENKMKIDICQEAGNNELEMIKREVEMNKLKLKNCEKYGKILKKGIESLLYQFGECNQSDQMQEIQLFNQGCSSSSEDSSSESSSRDIGNAEILCEDNPAQLAENVESAEISIPNEIIRPTFEDLTDSKRIKQLMDDMSSLVCHRDKVFSP